MNYYDYGKEIGDVLTELVCAFPYPLTASELVAGCGLPHGQRAGGILRRLRGDGLANSEVLSGERHWWADQAAVAMYEIFAERLKLESPSQQEGSGSPVAPGRSA